MLKHLKKLDSFTQNIILVFAGTTLVNIFNLVYQLLLAHQLTPPDFAAFNSLIAIFIIVSGPFGTFQQVIVKYIAEFHAQGKEEKTRALFSGLLRILLITAAVLFILFSVASVTLTDKLKVPSVISGYLLAASLALSIITPLFLGALQGLERFQWFAGISVVGAIVKLALTVFLLWLGLKVTGALTALLISVIIPIAFSYIPLKNLCSLRTLKHDVPLQDLFLYCLPIATAMFCFMSLATFDMVMVKYYFSPEDSGIYSLAQMVGKIFLFLPGAISIVMFPRSARLKAKNIETHSTLTKSLFYAGLLSLAALIFYNMFPGFVLTVLTGKAFPESIYLGRLFSISMTLYTLILILIQYFLSLKDFRFLPYLMVSTVLQFSAIAYLHKSLAQVQYVICANAAILFVIHLILSGSHKPVKTNAAL
ncbi:MAG TPA: oligosaccharide flippase family protein [Candidatus Omnitrophota bacterium]|nr:oligosaccharide flippase family protein [Candidatus Omnitrophota bacterium]